MCWRRTRAGLSRQLLVSHKRAMPHQERPNVHPAVWAIEREDEPVAFLL